MIKAVLVEPEIPPNTGNIARMCAAFGVELHLVGPLGFSMDNRYLKRAGLDYWPNVNLRVWNDWQTFARELEGGARLVMATTKGKLRLEEFVFKKEDHILFGPETRGLASSILALSPYQVRIPVLKMEEGGVRSLNLSTAAGIFIYTALAQCGMLPGR